MKYFVFKKHSLCGQKVTRKAALFIVLSRLSNKEDSVLQAEIVRPIHADRKYEFRAQLQISPCEQKYIVGVTIFSTCQHFHNEFILLYCSDSQIYHRQKIHAVSLLW